MAGELKKERALRARRNVAWYVGVAFCLVIAVFIIALGLWVGGMFGVSFNAIVNTLTTPTDTASNDTLNSGLLHCILPTVIAAVIAAVLCIIGGLRGGKVQAAGSEASVRRWSRAHRVTGWVCVLVMVCSLVVTSFVFGIPHYVRLRLTAATFYENNFVDPAQTQITEPEQPRNLIFIYLESMETTYASQAVGGAQESINYIPCLTALALENTSFSNDDDLGGFRALDGASWTMGALMTMSSGVTYELPIDSNDMVGAQSFCSGLTTIGDLLDGYGYTQEFLCGSGAEFAGRDVFFKQHGGYQIMDWHAAQEVGYLPEGYDDGWWGFEDFHLYEIAQQELTQLAAGEQPFNLTMLTVDTHHIGGHRCELCGDEYPTKAENVVACADAQIAEFIAWCQQQDWYENTTIVIVGDHPRMDKRLVKGVSRYERTVYNCFINPAATVQASTEWREFTAVDIFPTTLAALGFSIEGDRLGLGTDLFSSTPTLSEEHSFTWLDEQTQMKSDFYMEHFAPEMLQQH